MFTDQRVAKTCDVLSEIGYEVVLIGRRLRNSPPVDRKYKTKRFRLLFKTSFLFYAEYNLRLFFYLLFQRKEVLIANDLDTLLPNYLVSLWQRKKLIYDSHELFTEVPELVNKPFVKKFWTSIEKRIFPKLKNVIVVSEGIAAYYLEKYNIQCYVIRNLPTIKETKSHILPFDHQGEKTIMYQGAVNMGRGLELMIDTMPVLEGYVLMIAGVGDILVTLKEKVQRQQLEKKVFFLGRISPAQLQKITPLADMGISLEEDLGLNYRYALPNKLFDYIHAQIPVVVSDLPEMRSIVRNYEIGQTLTQRSITQLAALITSMEKDHYADRLKKAKKVLNWDTEKEKLITIFKHLY